uniref:Uncharacterized protein n=1 Tax=Castor canadensis TaxID=51338 RepID=A0A8C0XDM2_CASCN
LSGNLCFCNTQLACIQTDSVVAMQKAFCPGVQFEIISMAPQGTRFLILHFPRLENCFFHFVECLFIL